jgi:hypothetical protein
VIFGGIGGFPLLGRFSFENLSFESWGNEQAV